MDGFGELLGGLFGESAEAGGLGELIAGIFGGGKAPEREIGQPVTYERYLCGGPKNLNMNDR
jgi:hypothetical protein